MPMIARYGKFAPMSSARRDRFSAVILAIVESDLFQKRQAKEGLNIQVKEE